MKANLAKQRRYIKLEKGELVDNTEKKENKVSEEGNKERFFESISLASDLGFTIALPLAVCIALGAYLDTKFGTSPKLTLSLLFLGMIISVYNIYIIVKKNS